ncbi:hypothetical protein F5Y17DRAFT_446906 [Xylariaceae sp. FL0594]|nr:hypothetical protein F5Y17DRAFT_446906 [Xylariaceae sp. FL0594]
MNITSMTSEPDVDRGPIIIGLYSAECGISLIILILRLWARSKISARGWDDIFMVITWILFAVLTVFAGFVGSNGGTRHLRYLTGDQAKKVTRLNWIAQPFGIIALATGKLSVGFLLLRLLPPKSRWRRLSICVQRSLTMIANSISVVLTFAQCKDPAALWDPAVRATTYCWDPRVQSDFSTFTGSLNSAVDIIFSLLPITLIWNLQMSVRRRLGLIVLLGSGSFSGVSAAIKTSQLVSLTARGDLTWATFGLYLWTGIEIFVIIVCGCVPTLRPLMPRFHGSKTASRSTGTRGSFGGRYFRHGSFETGQEFARPTNHPFQTQGAAMKERTDGSLRSHQKTNGLRKDWRSSTSQSGLIRVTRSFQVEYGNPSHNQEHIENC